MSSTKRNALGRGLGALLGTTEVKVREEEFRKEEKASASPAVRQAIQFIELSRIQPNPMQPRLSFSEESLQELSSSIQTHGVLQPVLLTPAAKDGHYHLVAGERRFRAAGLARLEKIPAIIQKVSDEEMLEIAIVENVQRDDLNPVDEARAYRRLVDAFGWSQEQVAERVGKKRPTVANSLRLLRLNDEALKDLEEGRMTPGHARAILSIDDPFYRQRLRKEIVEKGISVREAERLATNFQSAGSPIGKALKKNAEKPPVDVDMVALQEKLMEHLGCRVRINTRDGVSGSVEVLFRDLDELGRFLQELGLET